MSSFAAKRKARVIKVHDDDDLADKTGAEAGDDQDAPSQPVFKGVRKPFRQSGLRKSINLNDEDVATSSGRRDESEAQARQNDDGGDNNDDDDSKPVVIRPALSRAGSTKQKKRQSSSRLSFGRTENAGVDGEDTAAATPKRAPLAQRTLEGNAFKKLSRLPMRSADDDEDRPRYSKAYLQELQSSTPNTPQNLVRPEDDDGMELDASELDGALIVTDNSVVKDSAPAILTEAEIRERKERRARLAHEQDFISLDDDDDGRISLRNKKVETRLVPEDEDLGEGFDEFVEDGGLSLGKKAEREARKRQRQEMAELIQQAENSEEEDDSEAERLEAFETAQTRAGMDGLRRPDLLAEKTKRKPKLPPIPTLKESLEPLHSAVAMLQQELMVRRKQLELLRKEKAQIEAQDRAREATESDKKDGEKREESEQQEAGQGEKPEPLSTIDGVILGESSVAGEQTAAAAAAAEPLVSAL